MSHFDNNNSIMTPVDQQFQASELLVDTSNILVDQHAPGHTHHHQAALQPLVPEQVQHQQQQVVSSQPISTGSSSRVAPEDQAALVYSIHPGFSNLDHLNQLLVKQKVSCESTCCGFESTNAYTVRSAPTGEPVLRAIESSSCCERCLCESSRRYELRFMLNDELIGCVRKPHRIARMWCYSNAVSVESPPNNPIGTIRQQFTLFGHSKFAIFDAQVSSVKPVFVAKAIRCRFCINSCLFASCCPNDGFVVKRVKNSPLPQPNSSSGDGNCEQQAELSSDASDEHSATPAHGDATGASRQVALISRNSAQPKAASYCASKQNDEQREDCVQLDCEAASPEPQELQSTTGAAASTTGKARKRAAQPVPAFGIKFEANVEPRHKVLLLAACFVLDFYYFESDRRKLKMLLC